MSLRKRIILSICFTIVIMIVILSAVIYSRSAQILNQESEFQMRSQLERAKENIDLRLKITRIETEKLAADESSIAFMEGNLSREEINKILTEKMKIMNEDENYYKDLFLLDLGGIIRGTTMKEAVDLDLANRPYVLQSQATLETVTSDALIARSDRSLIVNTVSPIYNSEGKLLGHSGIAIKAEYFSKIVSNLKLGDSGYYGIIDSNNRILAYPDKDRIYQQIPDETMDKLILYANSKEIYNGKSFFDDNLEEFQIYKFIDSNKWYVIAALPEQEMYSKSFLLLSYVMIAGTIGIIIAIILGYYIGNTITIPIVAITEYLKNLTECVAVIENSIDESIAEFKIPDSFEEQGTSDEIGNLRRAINNARSYFSSAAGFFEKESQRLLERSEALSISIEEISFRTAKFISTLSHDLKTSITLVKGYARGLNQGIIEDQVTKDAFLKGIIGAAEDLEKITCDILDNAYEAQCVPKLNKEILLIEEFARDLMESSKSYVEEENHIFIGNISTNGETLNIDRIKVKRVWNNILNNAVKYSKEDSSIECGIAVENGIAEFCIKDHGIGMGETDKSQIFSMFYRGERKTGKGYGLGLFISKSILDAHDSDIVVISSLGQGTSVTFYLKTCQWEGEYEERR